MAYLSNPEITSGLTRVSARCGELYVISSDQTVSKDIIELGHWAWDHVDIFKSILKDGQVFVDVGAFIGHHSVAILNAFQGAVPVVSIEGQPDYAHILELNLNHQKFDNYRVINAVASNVVGFIEVPTVNLKGQSNFGSLSYVMSNYKSGISTITIPQTTLDLELQNELLIGLIKIDVQTFELFVLQGALQVIKQSFPSIFVEISPKLMKSGLGYDYRSIYSLLVSFGYYLFDVYGNQITLNLIRNPDDYPEGFEWDILAIHQSKLKITRKIPWMS
jgi:FkbM family methyltransferase